MPVTLEISAGPCTGLTFTLEEPGTFLVGRAHRAHFQIPSGDAGDMRLSQVHFLIEYQPPLCELHDLNSHNGTYINGSRVQTHRLVNGDEIRAGQSVFRVTITSDSAAELTTTAPPFDLFQQPTAPIPLLPPVAPVPVASVALEATGHCCLLCATPLLPVDAGPLCGACYQQALAARQPIPDYLLLRELGRGAMGIVYLALNVRERSVCAIKTILPASTPKPTQVARFLREADILKQLDHANIITFRQFGMAPAGLLFLVTDYIPGTDLGEMLKQRGPLKLRTALRVVCQALQALEYAHAKGFVHRDIKPSNLLLQALRQRHKIKLTDFGLARVYQSSQLSGLTLSGEVGGTPAFIAPEQVLDYRNVSPAADQYSAAATLYNLLTGKFLYDLRGSVSAMLACVLNDDPVPILERLPALDVTLAGIIQRALSREPAERFANVHDFRKALIPFAR